ncbi:uncharacterized protein [Rutidosis leptorrhynchoides]|uniref:uncharacterized protein n=1 Tax=Rutidosis leptorrhynchoides TaxID=125765 RepID=UPI003A99D426
MEEDTWGLNDDVNSMWEAGKRYKLASKEAKRAVKEAKNNFFDGFHEKLDTKAGEMDMYKIARRRERGGKDINGIRCIKDEENKVLVSDVDSKLRWKKYFAKHFNGVQKEQIEDPHQ